MNRAFTLRQDLIRTKKDLDALDESPFRKSKSILPNSKMNELMTEGKSEIVNFRRVRTRV